MQSIHLVYVVVANFGINRKLVNLCWLIIEFVSIQILSIFCCVCGTVCLSLCICVALSNNLRYGMRILLI